MPPRANAANDPAICVVVEDVLLDMREFLADRDALDVTRFDGPHARRDVMEAVLVQQILHAGGWTNGVAYFPVLSYERSLHALSTGTADLSASSLWLVDIEARGETVAASAPVLLDGEFVAGFYTLPDNTRALAATNRVALRSLRAVSNKSWIPDWQALERLAPRELNHAPRWENMPRMLQAGRADFLLAPLQPTQDFSMTVGGVRLVPIPGIKIALSGTRHYGLSRQSPEADALRAALDLGLQRFRKEGRLRRAYEECGFLDPRAAGWTRITPSYASPAETPP
jgi:ABC-type amino acid transport substrate-binding protein